MSEPLNTIFISHSSKDKLYVEQLVKLIDFLIKEKTGI